jgi:hypothetical protein
LEGEIIVSCNGEEISIVKEVMRTYKRHYKMQSNREGHFVWKHENIKPIWYLKWLIL